MKKKTGPDGKKVLINVILDRSGSMTDCATSTISGYNEYINGLKADKETKYFVSLIQFDAPGHQPELTITYSDKPLKEILPLDSVGFQPRGMTPLYDAVGECIRRVEAKGRAVITVIITDGQENSSREFNQATIKALIAEKEAEGWGFVFLGADINAKVEAASMGIAANNAYNYSKAGTMNTYSAMASATMKRSAAIKTGGALVASAMSFMTPAQEAQIMQPDAGVATTTGGRPAEPPTFPKRTIWSTTKGDVSSS